MRVVRLRCMLFNCARVSPGKSSSPGRVSHQEHPSVPWMGCYHCILSQCSVVMRFYNAAAQATIFRIINNLRIRNLFPERFISKRPDRKRRYKNYVLLECFCQMMNSLFYRLDFFCSSLGTLARKGRVEGGWGAKW